MVPFTDYHDNSGDGGETFWPTYGGHHTTESYRGIFYDNDIPQNAQRAELGSRALRSSENLDNNQYKRDTQ